MSKTKGIVSPCLEAHRIVTGERREQYGDLDESLAIVAALWSTLLSKEITIQDVCRCMIALKLSRDMLVEQPDNLIDICGYVEIAHLLRNRKENGNDDVTES